MMLYPIFFSPLYLNWNASSVECGVSLFCQKRNAVLLWSLKQFIIIIKTLCQKRNAVLKRKRNALSEKKHCTKKEIKDPFYNSTDDIWLFVDVLVHDLSSVVKFPTLAETLIISAIGRTVFISQRICWLISIIRHW
jgi:hypothetical protein